MGKRKKTIKIRQCKYCGPDFIVAASGQRYCSKKCAGAWRARYGYHYKPKNTVSNTLCWDCKKATGGADCPWANEFKPVEGWDATPTKMKMNGTRSVDSYDVHKCPLFERG